ncbi:hypothetical protein Tco_0590848 [Tanacetum coccineum]
MKYVKETVKIRVCKGGSWERVDGALEYMPLNYVKRRRILPLLSSYSCLLEAVSEMLEIDANSDFMVTYNSDNDIVESSVNGRQSSNSRSNQQRNFIHATPSVTHVLEWFGNLLVVYHSGLVYCSGSLSGKYTILAVCQIVHCASGLSFLTAIYLIRQRFLKTISHSDLGNKPLPISFRSSGLVLPLHSGLPYTLVAVW